MISTARGRITALLAGCALAVGTAAAGATPANAGALVERVVVGRGGSLLTILGSDNADRIKVTRLRDRLFVVVERAPQGKVSIISGCTVSKTVPLENSVSDVYLNCGVVETTVDVSISLGGGNDILEIAIIAPRGSVRGDGGNDTLRLGNSKDDLQRPVPSNVFYAGGDGSDMIDYSAAATAVDVSLGTIGIDGRRNIDRDEIAGDVENVWGSKYDDVIYGTSDANVLRGYGGKDRIYGLDGNDVIDVTWAGADTVDCGRGSDRVRYRKGEDRVSDNCETQIPAES